MNILNKRDIRELEIFIEELYGSKDSFKKYVVLQTGKEGKIWISSKKIFELELEKLRINTVGLYFGRLDRGRLRLSIEGATIVGENANKNIATIDDETLWDFLRGFDVLPASLENAEEGKYVLVKYGKEWVGIAKLEEGTLKNCLPKSRKIISLSK